MAHASSGPDLLTELGITLPVLAAPMAGGATTPALVIAAGRSGGLGLLAAGYKDVAALADQVQAVRAAAVPFGVNLFAPNPDPISLEDYRAYARELQPEADDYQLSLDLIALREDDDSWHEKVDLLLADPVPVVSFTFGLPSDDVVAAFKKAGTLTVQTVTSAHEARRAAEAGVDALAVQASAAGGHSGTLTPSIIPPERPLPDLLDEIAVAVSIPLIGAGGISRPRDVTDALAAGAQAVSVGTALLRSDESGASAVHQAALVDPARAATVVTRAFTGRPARALRNRFTDTYSGTTPSGYPAIHHLTSPLRKAAVDAGDVERAHLWAADRACRGQRRTRQTDPGPSRLPGVNGLVRQDRCSARATMNHPLTKEPAPS
ncbi:NAD(P)H-dependent flavin oxidoreductase [Aeromicrobium sp. UC242_57]|uniref:NAD(P)H-dependent flavin oxidoreductase n=1 Tax=Aeromicrobium sp. UC242_57 TaxID=3374624 RepID=UPI0037A3483B